MNVAAWVGVWLILWCLASLLIGWGASRWFRLMAKARERERHVGPGSDMPAMPGGDAEVRDIRDARVRPPVDGGTL